MLTGENGIITKANKAKIDMEQARKDEEADLKSTEAEIEENLNKQYNEAKGVNQPKLDKGMIPVKYENGNWVITTKDDPEWYNYTEEDMKWANVMLSDGIYNEANVGTAITNVTELGSMFVWIPRYAYNINEYKTEKNGEGTTQNITNVSFLVGATNRDKDKNKYSIDYNEDNVEKGAATPKIVHPAFTFGGKNLTGVWVAKFEASMEEANNNTTANNNVVDKTVKIIPNAESWRYIQVGNCFEDCINMNKADNKYGLNETTNSHLMKNNEWGAVTYLAVSQYGKTPTRNTSGSLYTEDDTNKYHSYVGQGDYVTNTSQSTT